MPKDQIQMVLVDENDKVIGYKEKYATHKVPVPLHRAISIVIFDKNRNKTLITKRSTKKPTWPLFWSNTVCSHPYPNETYQEAVERRILEEVGFKTHLTESFRFTYEATMDNGLWGEHEYDIVFVGEYEGPINPNPDEIVDFKWVKIKDLKEDLGKNPGKYTPWFKIILEKLEV